MNQRVTNAMRGIACGAGAVCLAISGSSGAAESTRSTRSLEECVEIALAHHPSLGSAAARVDAGRERVRQTRAGYLPQVEAGYTALRTESGIRRFAGSLGAATPSGSANDWLQDAGFSLSQLLFDFGRNLDAIQAARARQQSLVADASTAREVVVFEVKRSYFDLLAARRLLHVAEQAVRNDRQQLELARARHEVGLAPRIDVTRSEVELASAELDRISAANNVEVAEDTLRNALGLRSPLDFEIEEVLEGDRIELDESEAIQRAWAARPELASNEALQRAFAEEVEGRRKQHLPAVSADAAYDWSGAGADLRGGWSVGANLRWPLWTGGRTRALVGEARAELEALRLEEESLRQDIALEVRTALLELGRAAQSIEVAARGAAQARENLELAEGRYATGVGSIIELSDAQTESVRAEAEHVRTLYAHRISAAALERAIGQPLVAP